MDERRFHSLADATLSQWLERLEPFYDRGDFEELDLADGVLTIQTRSGRTLILNRHGASQQLWLAAPRSGGFHFSYDETGQEWKLADGELLSLMMVRELAAEGINVAA